MSFEISYRELPENLFQNASPAAASKPELLLWNNTLAYDLGLTDQTLLSAHSEFKNIEDLKTFVFSGQKELAGLKPLAQAYAGHQFGHFNVLGDGRAHLIGEWTTSSNSKWPNQKFDLQLKGSGATAFSRRGDGRAGLGPMIREFLISEAMASFHVPTTRSLALVLTNDPVFREEVLKGTILTRVAKSHLRVGTFEFAAAAAGPDALEKLFLYTLKRHDPEIFADSSQTLSEKAVSFLKNVCNRQAYLISRWMSLGFIHGVMNTDNMTISGETIDYGPCAFMDTYDPLTVFSSIDRQGRYAYGRQPSIGQWNLARLADALLPLIQRQFSETEAIQKAESALTDFAESFGKYYFSEVGRKLGLHQATEADKSLFESFFTLMFENKMDYTSTFRKLADFLPDSIKTSSTTSSAIINQASSTDQSWPESFKIWQATWFERLKSEPSLEDSRRLMLATNPAFIPRNELVEQIIQKVTETLDPSPLIDFAKAFQNPYIETTDNQIYRKIDPKHSDSYQTFCGT